MPGYGTAVNHKTWMWSLAEQVIKEFVKGWFEHVQIVYSYVRPSIFGFETSPFIWFNARWLLMKFILGARRTSAVQTKCWGYVVRDYAQNLTRPR